MNKLKIVINLILFVCFVNFSFAAERIFYEDCENQNFSEYFLENHYGSNYAGYWQELRAEITQSTTSPHSGKYCMTYDPFITGNPHANVGIGDIRYGNTSNFDLSSHHSRYWYFIWYQRWQKGIEWNSTCENKIFYVNWRDSGDFTLTIQTYGKRNIHIYSKDHETRLVTFNKWITLDHDLTDFLWHKMEVYIDVGSTSNGNGHFWFKVDNDKVMKINDITWNKTINSNPIHQLPGWPSNISGNCSGSGQTWLDDLEIWTGLPPETSEGSIKLGTISNDTTENAGTATFTAKLDSQPTADVTLAFTSSDETEGIVSSSSITFRTTDWNQNKTVTVRGVDDHIADGDQRFNINILSSSSDSNYNNLDIEAVQVVNIDNDSPGFSLGTISGNTTENGGKATFTIKLNSQPMDSVTIALKSSDETEGTVSPAILTFGSSNWNAARVVTVTGVSDNIPDGDQAYTVILGPATSNDSYYNGLNPGDVDVVNLEKANTTDKALPWLQPLLLD